MGISRFLKKAFIPGYNLLNTVEKIADYGVVDGLKEKFKEDWLEDNPITGTLYQAGKNEGHKEGYIEASNEYEAKLLKQANYFLSQKKVYQSEKENFNKLLDEYECYIEELEERVKLFEINRGVLEDFISIKNNLKELIV